MVQSSMQNSAESDYNKSKTQKSAVSMNSVMGHFDQPATNEVPNIFAQSVQVALKQ